MKVLALTEGADHVCFRYRIEPFVGALAEHGAELTVLPLARPIWKRLWQFRAAARADVVILQRKLLPLCQTYLLRRAAKRLIYDIDDALFYRDSYCGKPADSWLRMLRYWGIVYAADLVLAGNTFLAERAARFTAAEHVARMPTCVTPSLYPVARHERHGRGLEMVWIGQQSTMPSLYQAEPCLTAAADACEGLTLRVISDCFPKLASLPVREVRWSRGSEALSIAAGDIGVSWLPDDAWSQGKCGLKVLQYMAAGLPVVGNSVAMNREMILPGETGYLADTPEAWREAVGQLTSASRRRRMGATAREWLSEHYSVESWADRFAALVAGAQAPTEIHHAERDFQFNGFSSREAA